MMAGIADGAGGTCSTLAQTMTGKTSATMGDTSEENQERNMTTEQQQPKAYYPITGEDRATVPNINRR